MFTVTAQIAVRAERTQDVLRGAHQQATQVRITRLGNAHLFVEIARLVALRHKSEISGHIARRVKAVGISDG
jgi:DNA repair ATPase RecN